MLRGSLFWLSIVMLSACGPDSINDNHLSSRQNAAIDCPSYLYDQNQPPVVQFSQGSFKYTKNKLMALTLKKPPYHFAKDLIIQEGQTGLMQAKFDYGSVFHKDLEDEQVEAYLFDPTVGSWSFIGTFITDFDGKVYVTVEGLTAGEYPIKFLVKGDGSIASGRITVARTGGQAVVFDLDSTLTTNDLEAVNDYLKIANAKLRPYAVELVKSYESLGYRIIYLTSRPYILIPSTQKWLETVGLPRGHLYSPIYFADSLNTGNHGVFKAEYLDYLQSEIGLEIVAAYGNAKTDIEAYEAAAIPKDFTFITGRLAGSQGTVAIPHYQPHLAWIEQNFANISCRSVIISQL